MATSTHAQQIRSILQEIGVVTSNDKNVQQRLEQCNKLLDQWDTSKSGILSRFSLAGQVALVTGGGQGIGRGFAHALGEAGAKVAVADIVPSRAESVVAELEAKRIEGLAIEADVSQVGQVETMVQKVLDKWGTLHVACNNAGILCPSTNSELVPASDWSHTLSVNLDGVFYCCQAEARHMLQKGYGRIINIASIASHVTLRPPLDVVAYNTSKAGVRHLTKCLAAEWAPKGVRVNSISPIYIDTPLLAGPELEPMRAQWVADIPVGRLGQVEDLVGALVFLASPAAEFVTGADVLVDGGHCCW